MNNTKCLLNEIVEMLSTEKRKMKQATHHQKSALCDTRLYSLLTMDETNSEDFSFDARTTSQQFQQRLLAAQQSSTEREINDSIVS